MEKTVNDLADELFDDGQASCSWHEGIGTVNERVTEGIGQLLATLAKSRGIDPLLVVAGALEVDNRHGLARRVRKLACT